ncbi:MAG: DUF5660 domain-containing protein [Candidatus Shapirobacteria bacterium]|nr:DUF5660 domain-containing protein [Candidatus Shapirobacteria bacterium]MDD5073747.1 DUF5660 domain-containing protein [Candidatus Shapirobacteria bacterium]MDD5481652.1 DUF5660 domain-containing protein [Candidatus Shapirobacteria bacterium]
MAKKVVQGNNNQSPKKSSSERDQSGLNLKDELTKELPQEFWNQITAKPKQDPHFGEILPGQTVRPEEQKPQAARDYEQLVHLQEKTNFQRRINLTEASLRLKDSQETGAKINQIKEQIKAIADNIGQINHQVEAIKTRAEENTPQEGRYQLGFLELLLSFLKDLRERVEEGNTWLAAFQKKTSKRNYFWNQVKKSGSKFLLSSDRTPATQTG